MRQVDGQTLQSAGALSRMHDTPTRADKIGLRTGRVHEVYGPGADVFVLLAAAEQACGMVWIGLHRDMASLCPTGLQAYLDLDDLILVEAVSRGELLWAADQALRAEGGFCVILDLPDMLSLKESRRLQLAAEQGGGIGLLILRGGVSSSAAQTRWHCAPVAADTPAWAWRCEKGKNGEAGAWHVTYQRGQNAKDMLHMATTAAA